MNTPRVTRTEAEANGTTQEWTITIRRTTNAAIRHGDDGPPAVDIPDDVRATLVKWAELA